jgi:hypothetical protein
MGDAFKCDRCDEFRQGSGTNVRYGVYHGTNHLGNSKYDFSHKRELCDECQEKLDDIVDSFFENVR